MHRIGIIADVHGNDLALKEVLKRLDGNVDEIISLGDLIGIGPNGNEVIDIVKKLPNFHTVLGNHERYFLYGFNNPLSCITDLHHKWVKNQISEENAKYIESIPVEIKRTYNGKTFIFLHYGRKNKEDLRFMTIEKDVCFEKIQERFNLCDEDYIFYGHEHIKSYLTNGKRFFINPGSLGCPYPDEDMTRYGILTIDNNITYQEYSFKYNAKEECKIMYDKFMPDRDFVSKTFYFYKEKQ